MFANKNSPFCELRIEDLKMKPVTKCKKLWNVLSDDGKCNIESIKKHK